MDDEDGEAEFRTGLTGPETSTLTWPVNPTKPGLIAFLMNCDSQTGIGSGCGGSSV
jgi:hypothetical protein